MIDKRIGRNIKKLRTDRSLKQKDLAKWIKITPTHLSQIENGLKHPSVQVILDIAEVLDVDPGFIITRDERFYAIQNVLKKGDLLDILSKLEGLNTDIAE